MISAAETARLSRAAPFWLSLVLLPVAALAAMTGGAAVLALPLAAWGLFTALDAATGTTGESADPETPETHLRWYRRLTLIWPPLQLALVFGTIAYATRATHLTPWALTGLVFGIGVVTGTVGIVYAHELMHQKNRLERWLGDILMASVLYSHFRSEHLLVHHTHVGTPRDAVTARYNEGFWRFFARVLPGALKSALHVEAQRLARRGLSPWHRSNPFWRYAALQSAMLAAALALGGPQGLALFAGQALTAIWQLETVNYVEHYGLTRRHLGAGRYERVLPRHSWNASHRATNWLLINLQRHSDHHVKPDRRFPLLQTYGTDEAPQLPFGYPLMGLFANIPPLWRRMMNPRVRAWRRQFYPDIADWTPYKLGTTPMPRT